MERNERLVRAVRKLREGRKLSLESYIDSKLVKLFCDLGLRNVPDEKYEEITEDAINAYIIVVKHTPSIREKTAVEEANELEKYIDDVLAGVKENLIKRIEKALML